MFLFPLVIITGCYTTSTILIKYYSGACTVSKDKNVGVTKIMARLKTSLISPTTTLTSVYLHTKAVNSFNLNLRKDCSSAIIGGKTSFESTGGANMSNQNGSA